MHALGCFSSKPNLPALAGSGSVVLHISKKYFSKTTLLEGLYVVFEKRNIQCEITDEICEEILSKKFFKDSTSGGTISITNMNKRWKGIYDVLSEYDE